MSTIHQSASKLKGKKKKIKSKPLRSLFNSPQKKGVVSKCRIMTPKKPNSAKRRVAKIRLSTKRFVTAKIKGQGSLLNKYAHVLVVGGRANDLPGVRYGMVKGKFDFNWKERFQRMNSRSKYGIKWDEFSWLIVDILDKLEEENSEESQN